MPIVVVVPCFNEADRWDTAYWGRMIGIPDVTWQFVNDGSTDATRGLIDDLLPQGPVKAIHLTENVGKAEAVRLGMLAALGTEPEAVGFMDADGAFNAADVTDLIASFRARRSVDPGTSAVWASRVALSGRDIRRSMKRHYLGRVVATYVSAGQSAMPYDTQAGLKVFAPGQELEACLAEPFKTRWLFDLELLTRWEQVTGRSMGIWEEPLNYWHDVPGSKIHGREVARIARELLVIKKEQRKAKRTESSR